MKKKTHQMRNKIEEISSIDNFFFSFVCYGQNVELTEGRGWGGREWQEIYIENKMKEK